jgi:hypothetical protein
MAVPALHYPVTRPKRAKRVSFTARAEGRRNIRPIAMVLRLREEMATGEVAMTFTLREKLLAGSVLLGSFAAANMPAAAQEKATPDFSSNNVGWVALNGNGPFFEAVPNEVPPVNQDPAHPFVPNGIGKQPTFRIADLNNPNLKPWVKEIMKKDNTEVLAGKVAFTWNSSCMPAGVPGFMGSGGPNPTYFLQTPKEVWIIHSEQVRRIYMDVPHSTNPKPSWYGESVGHYEGDTLVVDTIGLNDRLPVDVYRTPHTEKLHVVERWKVIDDGKMLQVIFTVADPDTFYQPWTGMRRYRRVVREITEDICAENNQHLFDYHIPVAGKPDF